MRREYKNSIKDKYKTKTLNKINKTTKTPKQISTRNEEEEKRRLYKEMISYLTV